MDTFINDLIMGGGGTSITKGLNLVKVQFGQETAHCHETDADRKKVALIIAADEDVPSLFPASTVLAEAQALRDLGVVIYAIGLKSTNETELGLITGDASRVITLATYDDLASIDLPVLINDLLESEGLFVESFSEIELFQEKSITPC